MIFSFVNPPCKATPPGARVIRPPEKSFFSKKVIIMCLDDHIKRKASSERILFKRAALIIHTYIYSNIYDVVSGVEPNFEDLDLVVDQADGETVDVDQADPHSNNIHVAHNNPKDRSASTITTVNTTCVQTLPLQ